jgi:hypothetical protein
VATRTVLLHGSEEKQQTTQLIVRRLFSIAMQALNYEDILAADADQRACLVLAVFELPCVLWE